MLIGSPEARQVGQQTAAHAPLRPLPLAALCCAAARMLHNHAAQHACTGIYRGVIRQHWLQENCPQGLEMQGAGGRPGAQPPPQRA